MSRVGVQSWSSDHRDVVVSLLDLLSYWHSWHANEGEASSRDIAMLSCTLIYSLGKRDLIFFLVVLCHTLEVAKTKPHRIMGITMCQGHSCYDFVHMLVSLCLSKDFQHHHRMRVGRDDRTQLISIESPLVQSCASVLKFYVGLCRVPWEHLDSQMRDVFHVLAKGFFRQSGYLRAIWAFLNIQRGRMSIPTGCNP